METGVVEVFEISTEILEYMPVAVGIGVACSCFVILTAGLLVSCVRTFLRMIGGR